MLDPIGQLSFIELGSPVALVDVEVANFLLLGLAGRERAQRCAAEKRDLDELRIAVEAEEPAFALGSVERRVPLHRLAHAGDGVLDKSVQAAADIAFPAGHRRDVSLDRGIAVALGDLWVTACEEAGDFGEG